MAPEVWRGVQTPKADVWSLGVVLFELLCLSLPYFPPCEFIELSRQFVIGGFRTRARTLPCRKHNNVPNQGQDQAQGHEKVRQRSALPHLLMALSLVLALVRNIIMFSTG